MIQKQSKKVSIIVPIYNVELYLRKCLNSLLNQTYKNIEIILIDDGSIDNSLKIINEEYISNTKIIYKYQKNAGLSAARNTGIKFSTGDYLCFVDGDDWLREDAIEVLMNVIEQDNSDIAIFNMAYIFLDGTRRKRTPSIEHHECIDNIEALRQEMLGKKYRFHAPNKICKRNIYIDNNIWFPVGKLYEDVATTYKLFLNKCRVSLVPEELYFYLQKRSGSITNSLSIKQFTDMFEALNGIINNELINMMNMNKEIQALYVDNIISLSNYIVPIYTSKKNWKEYYYLFHNDSNWNQMRSILKNKKISLLKRIKGFLITNFFPFYCIGISILRRERRK